MATQRPLVLISGILSELPQGDSVVGVSVGLTSNPSGLYLDGVGDLGYNGESLVSGIAAQATANTALSSGNSSISEALTKLPFSGGVVSGQFAQNVIPLGLYGSGINCNFGNYFTAILSGDTQVVITNPSTSVAYGLTYEVEHQIGTITWPTEVEWPDNTAPTLTEGKTHLFMFVTDDSGTTWRAASLIDYNT